jgi:pimeloyl-ACP methyl ester carboxylesterase
MQVELVSVETSDGVRLDGALRRPVHDEPGLGLDLVICHHGMGGNFYGPSLFEGAGDHLLEQGCAVLRVNSRGHDQMFNSPRGRLGAACEIVDDCRLDWQAWLHFAEAAGFRRVALWGHSLGAVKTIYTLAMEPDSRVRCAICSSPPRFSYANYAGSEDSATFLSDIERARRLVGAGKPDELLLASVPQRAYFAARTYLDKYGEDDRYDFFRHLPNVGVPLLLTLGGEENGLNFQDLAARGPALKQAFPNVSYALIDGADHSYSTRVAELWTAVHIWLGDVLAAAAAG